MPGTNARTTCVIDYQLTDPHPDETLTLSVGVTCASSSIPSGPSSSSSLNNNINAQPIPVSACTNCLAREAKRIERKKAARVRPHVLNDESESEKEGAIFFKAQASSSSSNRRINGVNGGLAGGGEAEGTGIVVFNCPEVNEFTDGRAVLPVRVTCYCRHHRE